jgi:hypothetical protein
MSDARSKTNDSATQGWVLGFELKTGQSHKAIGTDSVNMTTPNVSRGFFLMMDNEAQNETIRVPNDNVQLAVPFQLNPSCPTPLTFKLGNTDGFLGLYQ